MIKMDFRSIYNQGFVRVAACTTTCRLADPNANVEAILALLAEVHAKAAALAVFPELALSGYAIDDLLLQDTLHAAIAAAVERLVTASADLLPLILVGAPLRYEGRLYNCAVAIHRGQLLGVVPKVHLPNYREFYERRHFASGNGVTGEIVIGDRRAPFGPDLLFVAEDVPGLVVHAEICEDLWVPVPQSSLAALAGATVLANLSASNITIGKSETRQLLIKSQSLRCLGAYLYSAAGKGESTTDLAWDGETTIAENGTILAESARFSDHAQFVLADIDLDLIAQERLRQGTFDDNRRYAGVAPEDFRQIDFRLSPPAGDVGLERNVARFPFVPADPARLAQDCYEAYNIQVSALEQRLTATKIEKLVIGVSGGLDSTHALIVAAKAMDRLGKPRSNILAYTMPGFATSEATKANAFALMKALGVTSKELDITETARLMLTNIGHPYSNGENVYDVTFENVQAGLRTDYLFRLANLHGALVLGTGDLSELALGWATYGVGDQMSHYAVNAGVPKTLIQYLIRWCIATGQFAAGVSATLESILQTEISPELVPAGASGAVQSTEAIIGPYELQDFNLFYVLRYGFRPSKIAFLAEAAWADVAKGEWPQDFPDDRRHAYDLAQIRGWLEVFIRRFFGFSQFKRSALPNGPKVVAGGSLSPRSDWRAPSDGNAKIWLDDLSKVPKH
jgi:NAD+ synthase (glutamine-hydrolysing)